MGRKRKGLTAGTFKPQHAYNYEASVSSVIGLLFNVRPAKRDGVEVLDAVVCKREAASHLGTLEAEALQIGMEAWCQTICCRRYAPSRDLGFDLVNGVGGQDIQEDATPDHGLDKDLHIGQRWASARRA